MSLRREEAELLRALELSTQQVQALSRMPPHSLSSGTATDDSREMELRPVKLSSANTPQQTPQQKQRDSSRLSLLSPSPPPQVDLELGMTPPRGNRTFQIFNDSPASNIGTFPPATDETPASAIDLFPRTLETPLAHRAPSRVEVVIPTRMTVRESSVDPIDSLSTSSPPARPSVVESSGPSGPSSSSAPKASAAMVEATDAPGRLSARQKAKLKKEEKAQADRLRTPHLDNTGGDGTTDAGEVAPTSRSTKTKKADKKKPTKSKPKSTQKSNDSSQTKGAADAHSSQPESEKLSSAQQALTSTPPTQATSTSELASMPLKPTARTEQTTASSRSSPKKRKATPTEDEEMSAPLAGDPAKSEIQPATPASRPALAPAKSTPVSTFKGTPISWKTTRCDLPNVLSKFPRAKHTGMSKRLRIAPLHQSIGPAVKALPPPPPKSRKKVESEDEDDEEVEGKVKVGSRAWLMMED